MWSKFTNVTPALKILQYSQENTYVGSLLNKVAGPGPQLY